MPYTPEPVSISRDFNSEIRTADRNFEQLQQQDEAARAAGTLLGRYLEEPIADGAAFYEIIKINKKTVRIRLCSGLGDDYMLPYWGEETSIDKGYADQCVKSRDRLSDLCKKHRAA